MGCELMLPFNRVVAMDTMAGTKFDIHLVKVYDEDEDALAAYFELIEGSGISHGFFDSLAAAQKALEQRVGRSCATWTPSVYQQQG